MKQDVIVIGAGLAGLCCALRLRRAGVGVVVLDAADAVGGRVRTDAVDGFLLDRGFQVLLTAYPEARARLDFDALDLCALEPGARIATGRGVETIGDPLRRLADLWPTLTSGVATLGDKARVLRLRQSVMGEPLDEAFTRPDRTTLAELEAQGFSARIIEQFFRPFFGGVFFDRELATTARMFRFTWHMFAAGEVAVPARGMQQIPMQLAAGLPDGMVRLGERVRSIKASAGGQVVRLAGGETIEAAAVVVATDGASAARLLHRSMPEGVGTTCVYYDAPEPPFGEPRLMLDATGRGPINNLAVMSNVSPAYAPRDRALVSVSLLGVDEADDAALDRRIRPQLAEWFGSGSGDWRRLRVYRIPYALPAQPVGALEPPRRPVRLDGGLYVCGDHRDNASIQGAMVSGRRAAEAVIADRG